MLLCVFILGEIIQSILIVKLQVPRMILLYVSGQGVFFILFLYIFLGNSLKGNILPGLLFDGLIIIFNFGLFATSFLYAYSPRLPTIGKISKKKQRNSS
jgi:hypothetical protein